MQHLPCVKPEPRRSGPPEAGARVPRTLVSKGGYRFGLAEQSTPEQQTEQTLGSPATWKGTSCAPPCPTAARAAASGPAPSGPRPVTSQKLLVTVLSTASRHRPLHEVSGPRSQRPLTHPVPCASVCPPEALHGSLCLSAMWDQERLRGTLLLPSLLPLPVCGNSKPTMCCIKNRQLLCRQLRKRRELRRPEELQVPVPPPQRAGARCGQGRSEISVCVFFLTLQSQFSSGPHRND